MIFISSFLFFKNNFHRDSIDDGNFERRLNDEDEHILNDYW